MTEPTTEPTTEQTQPTQEPTERVRKTAPNAELPVWAQTTGEPSQQSVDEIIAKYSEHFNVGSWCGIPNYQCYYCDFATIDGVLVAVAHFEEQHAAPPPYVPPESQIVGPSGESLPSTLPPPEQTENVNA